MGTTGVIFAAIAIAWLAYLVPHFVRGRESDEELLEDSDPADRFADSMRIVRHGTAPLLDQDLEEIESFDVSTPQTRRAAVHDLRRLERLSAARRRRVLLGLLAALSAVIGVCGAHLVPWWSAAIPGGLLLIFIMVARISVRIMRKGLDARYRDICNGSTESTIFLSRKDFATSGGDAHSAGGRGKSAASPGTLWDLIPITLPTYVSKPLAPRTVRTIDLSGPGGSTSARPEGPVTADAPGSPSDAPAADAGGESRQVASA